MFLPEQLTKERKNPKPNPTTASKGAKLLQPTDTDGDRSAGEDSNSSSSDENGAAHEEDSSSVATDTSSGAVTSVRDNVQRGLVAASSNYEPRKT